MPSLALFKNASFGVTAAMAVEVGGGGGPLYIRTDTPVLPGFEPGTAGRLHYWAAPSLGLGSATLPETIPSLYLFWS